jgi:hypothetical protein
MARKKTVVPTYFNAVAWVALNDDTECMDAEQIQEQISAVLVADLFEKEPAEVAQDIIRLRKAHANALTTVKEYAHPSGFRVIQGGIA